MRRNCILAVTHFVCVAGITIFLAGQNILWLMLMKGNQEHVKTEKLWEMTRTSWLRAVWWREQVWGQEQVRKYWIFPLYLRKRAYFYGILLWILRGYDGGDFSGLKWKKLGFWVKETQWDYYIEEKLFWAGKRTNILNPIWNQLLLLLYP